MALNTVDFTTITETPGVGASREQWAMLATRYQFAASFSKEKDVLEAACGSGIGLGYLARTAKKLVGIDIDPRNVKTALDHYKSRNIEVQSMDAQEMSFEDQSFDVVILFEAVYYLERPEIFLSECRRVLRPGGVLLMNTVNPEWLDFNPSPLSTKYFSARTLFELLEQNGFQTQMFGAFPAQSNSSKFKMISYLKRTARDWGIMPRTMKGKEFLKRIFFGKLTALPAELENVSLAMPLNRVSTAKPVSHYKVLYAAAQKQG